MQFEAAMSMMQEFALSQRRRLFCLVTSVVKLPKVLLFILRRTILCFELPPVPEFNDDPWVSKCIALDGKIYLLGVGKRSPGELGDAYVFDLAGQRHWQKCAAMKTGRDRYQCDFGVLDGKIYALGGCSCMRCPGSKVYDPVENTWSPIKPLKSLRFDHQVAVGGDKLYVYNGHVVNGRSDFHRVPWAEVQEDFTLDIYHPLTDEWRKVDDFEREPREPFGFNEKCEEVFMAQGRLHAMTEFGIYVYDVDAKEWTHLHECLFDVIRPTDVLSVMPVVVLSVDDELLAIVKWWHTDDGITDALTCLIRSKGLGGEDEELVWQKAQIPPAFANWPRDFVDFFLSPVQV